MKPDEKNTNPPIPIPDITFHVVLHSPYDVVNSARCPGVLILTSYRLIFCSEELLLNHLSPPSTDPPTEPPTQSSSNDFTLDVQVPIMLIASVDVVGSDLVVKTKVSEYEPASEAISKRSEAKRSELVTTSVLTPSHLLRSAQDSRVFWFDLASVHLKEVDEMEDDTSAGPAASDSGGGPLTNPPTEASQTMDPSDAGADGSVSMKKVSDADASHC